jgi:hypothetical protein
VQIFRFHLSLYDAKLLGPVAEGDWNIDCQEADRFCSLAMKTETVTRPRRLCGGRLWHTGCGVLTLICLLDASDAMAQSVNVVASNETAPPGATVEIKFTLAQPAAISSGELALNLDPTVFGGVTAIAAFSAAGDAAGYASVSGSHVDIHFASPSASMGSAAGMPLVVIIVPILATAKAGAQTAITADPTGSVWNGPLNSPAYTVSVTAGRVTVGGTLSVSSVSPVFESCGACCRTHNGNRIHKRNHSFDSCCDHRFAAGGRAGGSGCDTRGSHRSWRQANHRDES